MKTQNQKLPRDHSPPSNDIANFVVSLIQITLMKHYLISFLLVSISYCSISQNVKNTLEILPYERIDWYPEFSYVLNGRPSTDYIKIKGVSLGADINYKVPIARTWSIRPGLGIYRYSFNNIERRNTSLGNSSSKNINFVSPLLIPYFTDKYWYNSVSVNIGIEKTLFFKGNYQVQLAADIKNYWTFSQFYHLTNNPGGEQSFKKNDTKYFGASTLLTTNVLKSFGSFSIGPSVRIPIFDLWKTDSVFPEETGKDTRNKMFGGVGFGVAINYSLTKNK